MKTLFIKLAVLLLLPMPTLVFATGNEFTLPPLNIDKDAITVSGLSSGAFMAAQLSVAYSSYFKGAGIVAGGVYGCAQGDANTAKDLCMRAPEKIQVSNLTDLALQNEKAGSIDPTKNIRKQRIFLIHGTEDQVVGLSSSQKLKEFYQYFGASPVTGVALKMGHGFPTVRATATGVPCEDTKFPWMNKCNYDGAKAILEKMYGPLQEPNAKAAYGTPQLKQFDQTEFADPSAKMLSYGHVYIPEACTKKDAQCRLHIALHGCMQSPNLVARSFVEEAGYNPWAEANGIVILYPAVTMSAMNGAGCWDWWGYTGKNYATRSAPQLAAIIKMIDRLAGTSTQRRP